MHDTDNLEYIIRYCEARGMKIFRNPGELNIIYIEGMNIDYTVNADRLDQWNDLRLLVDFVYNTPRVLFWQIATTEPGRSATFSESAKKNGGVARVMFGQYLSKWKMGWHKGKQPALVQAAPLKVHRDSDRNGIRPKDPIDFATGINHHTTSKKYKGQSIGNYSEGCLVGREYDKHLQFIALLKTDPRYIANKNFLFSAIILPGDQLMVPTSE
jgi:hypothetical protein